MTTREGTPPSSAARPVARDPVAMAFVYGLGGAVALAWLASVIASILDHTYVTPVALHGLMGTIVGSVFADVGLRRARQRLVDEATERRRAVHSEP